jgi:hypothetical protein
MLTICVRPPLASLTAVRDDGAGDGKALRQAPKTMLARPKAANSRSTSMS